MKRSDLKQRLKEEAEKHRDVKPVNMGGGITLRVTRQTMSLSDVLDEDVGCDFECASCHEENCDRRE